MRWWRHIVLVRQRPVFHQVQRELKGIRCKCIFVLDPGRQFEASIGAAGRGDCSSLTRHSAHIEATTIFLSECNVCRRLKMRRRTNEYAFASNASEYVFTAASEVNSFVSSFNEMWTGDLMLWMIFTIRFL